MPDPELEMWLMLYATISGGQGLTKPHSITRQIAGQCDERMCVVEACDVRWPKEGVFGAAWISVVGRPSTDSKDYRDILIQVRSRILLESTIATKR